MEETNGRTCLTLLAPLSGEAVPLEQVGDDVFARKLLGDGIAIVPSDGNLYAPVDGTISAVMDTNHAYGFSTETGLELLVHVGLDSVSLRGQGFTPHVREGDRVKAGQLVAEVDLDFLKSKGVPTITSVLVCEGPAGLPMHACTGPVTAGKDTVSTLGEAPAVRTSIPGPDRGTAVLKSDILDIL